MGLLKTLKYYWRSVVKQADESLQNPIRDSQFQIEDAEKEINQFEHRIAKLVAAKHGTERQLAESKLDVSKWKRIAENAAGASNKEDARAALQNQIDAENSVKELSAELKTTDAEAAKLIRQLDEYNKRIKRAKNNNARFAARLEGAEIQQSLAQKGEDLNNVFGSLDELEKKANEAVDMASAYDEINSGGDTALADKYALQDSDVESRLEKLMTK